MTGERLILGVERLVDATEESIKADNRERVRQQAAEPFCRNAVHRNKTVKDGAGRGWFTRGKEVKPK